MIDPIHAMPTLIFSMEMNAGNEEGTTNFVKICNLFAPSDFKSSSLFSSVDMKPFSMFIVVTMMPTSTVMHTIASPPVPNQMITSGPSAIFGRALITTR